MENLLITTSYMKSLRISTVRSVYSKWVTIQQEMCSVTVRAVTHTNRQLRTTREASIDSRNVAKRRGFNILSFFSDIRLSPYEINYFVQPEQTGKKGV